MTRWGWTWFIAIMWVSGCTAPTHGPGADERVSPHEPKSEAISIGGTDHERRLPGVQASGAILLPNQWSLRPAGQQVALGDFPVNIAIDPRGAFAVVLHAGFGTHEIVVVDIPTRKIVSRATLPQAFVGICFDHAGTHLYASGGEYEVVHKFAFKDGFLAEHELLAAAPPGNAFVVAGLATSADDATLYVCGTWGHQVAALSLSGEERQFARLDADTYPYAVLPSADGRRLYVTLWGGSAVAVLDAESLQSVAQWPTPSHPTELALSPDGGTLYVACSNANQVAVLDASTGKTLELISTALYPTAPNGSTPNSLALAPDGTLLAVANADNNNLAIINVSNPGHARPMGFIPTGWYPTSVRFTPEGEVLVANGKGLISRANRHGPNPVASRPRTIEEYIAALMRGTLGFLGPIDPEDLRQTTAEARTCSPLRPDAGVTTSPREADNPIPARLGEPSPIKHCIYIIKENRTYDQVFGDLPQGNGDETLCIFGETVTPNLHALARDFVLLDNFYVESEVSADGHEWTTGAYATDFVEKTWPLTYRPRGENRTLGYPAEGNYDIATPAGGYIWDRCRAAGVSYRSYGEFVRNAEKRGEPGAASVEALEGHFDPLYRGFDLAVTDVSRAQRFIEELHRFEREGEMPQFIVARLPNDHTAGTREGYPTPIAMVADNDLAVGMVVEAVSRSRFWKDTAIFIVEDDAQNGSDHVDAHRTVALVVSPYAKRGAVDSAMYSTASMLRTMELILGLEPMSQFDAAAQPMYASFTGTPDFAPYHAKPAQVDVHERNLRTAWGADVSATLDLASEDAADDLVLNEIVWRSVRGADSPMPPPVRAAFVFPHADDD